jgi:hypothetical protein
MASEVLMAAAPEIGVPLEIGRAIAPHATTFIMLPFVVVAIILVIVGVIMMATAKKSKLPGSVLTILGFMVGGGALFVAARSEGRHSRGAIAHRAHRR